MLSQVEVCGEFKATTRTLNIAYTDYITNYSLIIIFLVEIPFHSFIHTSVWNIRDQFPYVHDD